MKVLSLFDGMACGYEALKRAGITVESYSASEIDKYAIQIANKNHPDIRQLGDVVQLRQMLEGGLKMDIDLLIGGSPCQGFSFAGKQLAFDDPRSALFFEYVKIYRILKKRNPNLKFLLENVRMKKEHLAVITEQLDGVEPHFINSALVSAQNRQRYYWYNWHQDDPEDRGILLKDILECGAIDRDKSLCIDANYWKGGNPKQYFEKNRRQLVFDEHILSQKALDRMERKKYSKPQILPDKTGTLNTRNNSGQLGFDSGTTLIPYKNGYRKLTPIECERLMSLPDNYTEGVSNTQRYKMLGNGWEVETIAHILRGQSTNH